MGTDTFDLAKSLEIAASEGPPLEDAGSVDLTVAENILLELAAAFPLADSLRGRTNTKFVEKLEAVVALPEVDARYRTLVEQIPAVVFMAFLDKGIGEAYVSPQIEAILGFSRKNGSMIRFVGTSKYIQPTKVAGVLKRLSCFCQVNR